MTHGVTSCSSVPPFRELFAAYAVKKRNAEQGHTPTACAAPCYLIQSHDATLFIQFHVLWLERHSRRTVRLSLLRGLRDDVLFRALSLSRDHCTLSMVLTERKHNKRLSIYSPLCCRLCFSAIPFSVSTALLRFSCSKSEAVSTLQQRRAIFRKALKTMLGTSSRIRLDGSHWGMSCNTWLYLSPLVLTFDFLGRFS